MERGYETSFEKIFGVPLGSVCPRSDVYNARLMDTKYLWSVRRESLYKKSEGPGPPPSKNFTRDSRATRSRTPPVDLALDIMVNE